MIHLLPFLVTKIRIGSGKCNSERFQVLDLSQYKNLKSVVIGDASYKHVKELKMIGFSKLESVEIGMSNFLYASLELKSILILDK